MKKRELRIATWNLQRPRNGTGKRAKSLLARIEQINADIWILTETHSEISPGIGYQGFTTDSLGGFFSPGEGRTAIWSRLPVKDRVLTYDSDTAVCLEIDLMLGPTLVFGTVLPYHGAGTKHTYRSNGHDNTNQQAWQLHYAAIAEHDAEWRRLREQYPKHHLCIGGDFNQSRDGRLWGDSRRQWYGTERGRQALSESFRARGIQCLTEEDFVETGKLKAKSSVEHLCFTEDLARHAINVGAWDADVYDDSADQVKRVSDHNGLYVDF
jgi:endonuclease/exonuclease/phosphatase (EEP) superfamily protein YafD